MGGLEQILGDVRYFIAIALADEARERLMELQPTGLPGSRLLGRDELHLTLHFLGELSPASKAAAVREALADLEVPEFSITLQGVGRFPPDGPAQVLWAGVQPSQPLLALHQAVGTALAAAVGFRSESRPYSPHISLARLDQGVSSDAVGNFLARHKACRMELVRLWKFGIYSSRFIDNIPHYTEVASVPLRKQGAN